MNKPFEGTRVVLKHVMTIHSTPDTIFPLLCPVRENEWVDGWSGRAIHSKSGVAERDGVFASVDSGQPDTIWYVTEHDPKNHVIEFVFFMPGRQVVRLRVVVTAASETTSTLSVEYIRTGISVEGNESIETSKARFMPMVTEWEKSLGRVTAARTILDRAIACPGDE